MVNVKNGVAEFRFFRPDVAAVHVAGEFNDWRTDQLAMTHQGDGYWRLEMPLPAGTHKFRYFAEGQWYTDFAAFGVEPGQFGLDSVIHVPIEIQAAAA